MTTMCIISVITCGAKLLNADWLRQRAFFLNQEGTYGNQEGMITWCWLAEHACIKLVSRFKRILKRNFRNASLLSLILTRPILTWKKINTQQSAVIWWKSQRIFPTKTVLIRRVKTVRVGTARRCRTKHYTELRGKLKATSRLISITGLGHLIGVEKQHKFCRYVTCSQWKGEFWIQEVIRGSFGH